MTTTKTKKKTPKSKASTKKRSATTSARRKAKPKAKPAAKTDASKARWDKKAQAAASQQGTPPPPATKPVKRRAAKPRIALAEKAHTAEITKTVRQLPTSKDHICWKRNGQLNELYFRIDGKTPILFSAPATSPVDDNGYRIQDAVSTVTGVFHIKQAIKKLTGKTPSALGIKLPRDASEPDGNNTKALKPRKKRDGLSGLDAAAQVLAKAKEPMNAKVICEKAIELGWKTNGSTPHATLYAAMIREIAAKGDEARFIKVDKGLFTANGRAV